MSRTFKTDPYDVNARKHGYDYFYQRTGETFRVLPEYLNWYNNPCDRQYLRQRRKAQRATDKQIIRITADWDAYSHPRHPFPGEVYLPSW